MNDALRIAREQRRIAQMVTNERMLHDIINNPVVELVGAYMVIQTIQRLYKQNGFISEAEKALLMTAVTTTVAIQQLSPSIPTIAANSANVIGDVTKAIPSLIPLLAGA